MAASREKDTAGRLIIALDSDSYEQADELVRQLSPHVGWFKIGSVLFTREGPRISRLVKDAGAKLFLDLKFHDIPNTVRGAVISAASLGADMITVHSSGGQAMMRAAVEGRSESRRPGMIIVGVTVLTHLDMNDFRRLLGARSDSSAHENTVVTLAQAAQRSGIDGVVASARELCVLKERLGSRFIVVTPGIRLMGDSQDDQTRVATPARAVADGADYLVVGRPVTAASDPVDACRRILEDMGSLE